MIHYIYKLYFQEEPKVFYIGQTNNIDRRYYEHNAPSQLKANNIKNHWIKNRLQRGWKLKMVIIDSASEERIDELEISWIAYYRGLGFKLKNGTDGGRGTKGYFLTDSARERMRAASIGRTHTAEARKKISIGNKGKKHSKERIEARLLHTYRVTSPEGEIYTTNNLNAFSKERGLHSSHMFSVVKGIRKSYKGWNAKRLPA